MVEIRRVGRFLAVDELGFIVNECRADLIVSPWSQIVGDLLDTYRTCLGETLHSIYIRGSVAMGTAVPGLSDVDSVAVVTRERSDLDLSWRSAYLESAHLRFSFATLIEANICSLHALLTHPRFARMRFLLKIQGLCVYGDNLIPTLPKCRPDRTAIFYAPTFVRQMATARHALDAGYDPADVCRWIMKAMIRSAFELVLEAEGRYTRDLYPCSEAFAKYYPDREVSIRQALALALNPPDSAEPTLALLDDFGSWLVTEASRRLSPPHHDRRHDESA